MTEKLGSNLDNHEKGFKQKYTLEAYLSELENYHSTGLAKD